MRLNHLRLHRHISLSWLLWLVWVLPLAQSAAQWHGYSHLAAEAGAPELSRQTGSQTAAQTGGQTTGHSTPCNLCLGGTTLDFGGLLSTLPGLLMQSARHAAPLAAGPGAWLPPLALAYLSRAPPAPR